MGRPAFVDDEIQGGLPVSLKLKYKIVLYACKSSFLLLKFSLKKSKSLALLPFLRFQTKPKVTRKPGFFEE